MSPRVLVTGASGFIGRGCLEKLAQAGFAVHAVGVRDHPQVAQHEQWHKVNLLDPASAASLIARVRPTHLLHLAWVAGPGVFWTSPDNLRWLASSIELVRAFFAHGGKRVVGAGTCAEYAWVTEDFKEGVTPLAPDTVYGRCKLAAGLAFEAAALAAGGSAAWARLFFPYGPGDPSARLIPSVIRGLLKREPVECTHGNQVRDFIFVDDAAEALLKLLTSPATGAFNVGSGRPLSVREVVSVICARVGGEDLVRFGAHAAPPGDPPRAVADITRMRQELGWEPRFSIEAGIERTIAAWRQAAA